MGDVNVTPGGGSGVDSDNATASAADILSGKTAGIAGADEPVAGTMPNNGAWRGAAAMNSSITIPRGYHDGSGAVSGPSVPYQNAEVDGDRAYATNISCGPGQINLGVRNGYYLNGVNWIKGSFPTLTAANIKKGVNIGGVVGTWEGYVTSPIVFVNETGYTSYCPNGTTIVGGKGGFYVSNSRLEFTIHKSSAGWTWGRFNDPFVVTEYNYVSVTFSMLTNLRFKFALGLSTDPNANAINVTNVSQSNAYIEERTLTLDISSLSGSMYVLLSNIGEYEANISPTINIKKIWFYR